MNFKYRNILLALGMAVLSALGFTACGDDSDPEEVITPPATTEPAVKPASSDVIYEANPRLFAENGCLNAITAQLPRLEDMGITILWLMPIQEPGVEKGIGSPYCIRDFRKLNERYGTMDDLKRLVNDAHSRGIKVIIDWVCAQTSWDCSWITEHPDFYKHNSLGEIISPSSGSQVYADVAALDYSNRDLWTTMEDAMIYWLDAAGIDGFRLDFVEAVPSDFWKACTQRLKEKKADIFLLAETGQASYFADGFDMIYDWGLEDTLASAMKSGKLDNYYAKANASMDKVPEGKGLMRYIYSHDTATEDPIPGFYGNDDAMLAAYALTALYGGTPMIYSGMDAENMNGTINFFNYNPLTWSKTLSERFGFINELYAILADFRNGTKSVTANGAVATFTYKANGHTALVMINTSDKNTTSRLPMAAQGIPFTGNYSYKGTINTDMTVHLASYGYIVLTTK